MLRSILMALLTLLIKLSIPVCVGNGIQYPLSHSRAASLITPLVRSPMGRCYWRGSFSALSPGPSALCDLPIH